MKLLILIFLIILNSEASSQENSSNGNLLSNNNHYLTENFEFFAEAPTLLNRGERTDGGNTEPDSININTRFRKFGEGRSKVFVMPNVYLSYNSIAIYASDGESLTQKIIEWKNEWKKNNPNGVEQPVLPGVDISDQISYIPPGAELPNCNCPGFPTTRLNLPPNPKIEELKVNEWEVWFFISMQPDVLLKWHKEEMIRAIANLHYGEGEDEIKKIIDAYSFEPLSVVAPTIRVMMGSDELGSWSSDQMVTSDSTYVIQAKGLDSSKIRMLKDGLFSVEVEGEVSLTRDSFASLILNYAELSSVYGDYFYDQIIQTKSKKKRRFFKSSTSSSVYRKLEERIRSSANRGSVRGGSYIARDSAIGPEEISRIFNGMFPQEQSTIADLLKSHSEALKEISANTDDDVELRKKIHEAYITYLQNAVSPEAEEKANEEFNSSLDNLAESTGDKRAEVGAAFVKFLKAGFSTGTVASNQRTTVVRYINQDEFESQESRFSINTISTVSRGFHIVRADFFKEKSRSIGSSINRDTLAPGIFDVPPWVDPKPDWSKSSKELNPLSKNGAENSLYNSSFNPESDTSNLINGFANTFSNIMLDVNNAINSEDQFLIEVRRNMTCEDGSIMGELTANGKLIGRTLELPWKDDKPFVSHIPRGMYSGSIRDDGNLSWRVQLDHPERKYIQIHKGNFQEHTQGCILLGKKLNNNRCGVQESISAMGALEDEILSFSQRNNMSVPIDIKVSIID